MAVSLEKRVDTLCGKCDQYTSLSCICGVRSPCLVGKIFSRSCMVVQIALQNEMIHLFDYWEGSDWVFAYLTNWSNSLKRERNDGIITLLGSITVFGGTNNMLSIISYVRAMAG